MTTPHPAATVVLLRDSERGPELLMVRRSRAVAFMADAHVFPGGRIDPEDLAQAGGDGEAAFAIGGARELLEEAAVQVAPSSLVPLSHWITPSSEPKRFDARFFVARMPPGQTARHDTVEAVDHLWATVPELLARYRAKQLKLAPPTLRNLEDLAPFGDADAALAWARARVIVPILPKLVPLGETLAIVLPWDREYASLPGEGQPIDPAHPIASGDSRFLLEEGRWWGRRG
jgi:8-oxo-dGTP pyrophosphatase MutT (NUDIX family)